METTLEPPAKPAIKTRTSTKAIDWERVKELYLQGFPAKSIAIQTGYNVGTIEVGLTTRGIRSVRRQAIKSIESSAIAGKDSGDRLKHTLGTIAQSAANQLAEKTPKNAEKLNLHVDSALKTAKLGATIYGWDSNVLLSIVTPGTLGGMDPQEQDAPAIDVESETKQDEA